MSTAGTADLPLELFSGYCSDIAPSDLPAGASPANNDIQYILGGFRTRPGLGTGVFAAIGGNPTVNYEKTFIDNSRNKRFLFLDALGSLHEEYPQNTVTNGINTIPIPANSYAKSATAYGREYLAVSDGQFGISDPASWDGVTYDRVSQVGPGAAPAAADEIISVALLPAAAGIGIPAAQAVTGASEVGNIVTLTLAGGAASVGDPINVAGVGTGYDGQWKVLTKPAGAITYAANQTGLGALGAGGTAQVMRATVATTGAFPAVVGGLVTFAGVGVAAWNVQFTVFQADFPALFTVIVPLALMGTAASGGGTVTTDGHVPAGLHQVSVFFVTRTGYYTKPAPPSSWTAAGGRRVIVSNIPVGPPNVIQRILIFTTAAGAVFFFTTNASNTLGSGGMVINDNTTTTLTVDFTDVILAAGSNAQYLYSLIELEECAGVVSYATRLFWWGMRNRVPNFLNLSFDGGFSGSVPLGWTLDATSGAGGASSGVAVWGRSYSITGNGATAIRGMISQPAYQDWQGNVILRINTAYSARVKLKQTGVTQGNFVIEIFSATQGSLGTFSTVISGVSQTIFQEFIGPLMVSQATIPTDAVLRIYANGTVNNFALVLGEEIEIFPTLQPYLSTTMRGSLAGQPESYVDLTGVLQPFFQDGGTIRNAFVLREKLYIQKDDKWYETVDDGANEPSSWKITQVSGAVGAAGPFASDVGEDWGIVANRSGPYIFWGGEPVKIGQEVQSDASQSGKVTWSSINWQYGYTIWVLIDKVQKRVLIGAPTGAATSPNVIFYLDYRGLDTAQEIADHWSVKYSQYSGKILAIGNAPKWSVWNIAANSGALIERSDGTTHTFLGNGAGTGRIYDLLDSNKSDGEAGIPWSYTTYYAPGHADEQVLNIKSHRKLFSYLTGAAKGSGAMSISMQPMGNITPSTLQNLQLVDPSVSAAITAISRVNSVVTVTCGAGHGLTNGIDTQANVSNAADSSFNGTVPILAILNPTQYTYYQALPDLILGAGGTVSRLWREFEYTTNTLGERVAYTFANAGNAAGCWAQLEKIIMSLAPDVWSPVRGSTY